MPQSYVRVKELKIVYIDYSQYTRGVDVSLNIYIVFPRNSQFFGPWIMLPFNRFWFLFKKHTVTNLSLTATSILFGFSLFLESCKKLRICPFLFKNTVFCVFFNLHAFIPFTDAN